MANPTDVKPFEMIAFINGHKIDNMGDDEIFDVIRILQDKRDALASLKIESKVRDAKVEEINRNISSIVAYLDGRNK